MLNTLEIKKKYLKIFETTKNTHMQTKGDYALASNQLLLVTLTISITFQFRFFIALSFILN